jgi:hypothetical protein
MHNSTALTNSKEPRDDHFQECIDRGHSIELLAHFRYTVRQPTEVTVAKAVNRGTGPYSHGSCA